LAKGVTTTPAYVTGYAPEFDPETRRPSVRAIDAEVAALAKLQARRTMPTWHSFRRPCSRPRWADVNKPCETGPGRVELLALV